MSSRHAEVREQHVLVVAAQEDRVERLVAETQQAIDERADGRPAVDVVPEEHDRVAALGRQRLEQDLELVGTAVQVADRVDAHDSPSSLRSASRSRKSSWVAV